MQKQGKVLFVLFLALAVALICTTPWNYRQNKSPEEPTLTTVSPVSLNGLEPIALIAKVVERQKAAKTFQFSMEVKENDSIIIYDIFIKQPDQFAAMFSKGKGKKANAMGVNHENLWFHFTDNNTYLTVKIKELGIEDSLSLIPVSISVQLEQLKNDYDLNYLGATDNSGAVTIKATPKKIGNTPEEIALNNIGKMNIEYKIDPKNLIILGESHKSGAKNVVITYKNATYDKEISEATFAPPVSAKLEPDINLFYFLLTSMSEEAKNWKMAELFNQKQLETIEPNDVQSKFSLTIYDGHYKYNDGRYQEALESYQKIYTIIALSPEQTVAVDYHVALCQWRLQKYQDAITSFQKVAAITDSVFYADAMLGIARINYESFNDKQTAINTINAAIPNAPDKKKSEFRIYLDYINGNLELGSKR